MDSNRPTTSDPQRTPLDQGSPPAAAEATVTREAAPSGKSVLREYVEAIVVAMLLAFAIRVFVVQAFKIPSGSMIPTLLIGDHILVSKLAYGIQWPTNCKFQMNLPPISCYSSVTVGRLLWDAADLDRLAAGEGAA